MQHGLLDYTPDIDTLLQPSMRPAGEAGAAGLAPADELALAAELLDRVDTGELNAYLVELIDRASLPRRSSPSAAARLLARALGHAARRLMPRGGSSRVELAARVFGLELEGLSAEDQSFEVARRFVRFVHEAGRRLASASDRTSPGVAARRAAESAARVRAPGLAPAFAAGARPIFPWDAGRPASRPPPRLPERPGFIDPVKEPVMHDIDRTTLEFSSEMPGFESESFEFNEGEYSAEGSVLSESDEYALASELLGVSNEEELDQFLGSLIKKVAQGAGRIVKGPIGQAVGGVLKGVAKKALPLAGGALGGWIGGPLGAKIGSGLASAAGGALGLEGESLSQEDEQYEGAKQFVKLAANTVAKAASAPPSADPRAVAQQAAIQAARQLAPGLLKAGDASGPQGGRPGAQGGQGGQGGRWARRGNRIVLYGV